MTEQAVIDFSAPAVPAAAESDLQREFDEWKDTPGGKRIMQDLYVLANQYARVWRRTFIPVSMKLLYEVERHRIKCVTARAQSFGIKLGKHYHYTLDNNFTSYIARHIMAHRRDLDGLFEVRELRAAS